MPIVEHQVKALADAGVDHIVLAVGFRPEQMLDALKVMEEKYKIKISVSIENEPMGTAGPLRLAKDLIMDPSDSSDSLFVFNSDVICDFPLREMKAFHVQNDAEATIVVTRVKDPSKFGVVVHDASGKVDRFVEKPTEWVGDCINAGLYILKKKVIDRIQPKPTSIERETFPSIAAEGGLFCMTLEGYWADVGQPKDFLAAVKLYLEAETKKGGNSPMSGGSPHVASPLSVTTQCTHPHSDRADFIHPVLIDPTAKVGEGGKIGPNVVIGPNCEVGDGVRLRDTCLLEGAVVGNHSCVTNSIVAWGARIGSWVRVDDNSVIGEGVSVAHEVYLHNTLVLPHKDVKETNREPSKIIM